VNTRMISSGQLFRRAVALLVACGASIAIVGCGYSSSADDSASEGYRWGSLHRRDVKTVAVPMFQSRSFFRGDEMVLTQALVNQIESRTPYKVTDASRADSILEGEVTKVEVTTVSQSRQIALPQEQLYTVTISFTWKNLRTGQVLVDRRGFEQTVTFYPTLGEGRFTGKQDAAEKLAAGIVDEMQGDW
jgi:hypothetical protein